MSYRSSASFGKRNEFVVMGELLKRGFDVYMTLVDDQQIDCIIRKSVKRYLDIQIKARSKKCKPYDAGRFAAMTITNPRKNYFFIFHSEWNKPSIYWIIPSMDLVKMASQNKTGENIGKYHINLMGHSEKRGVVYPHKKFGKYENAFHLLK